MQRVTEVQLKKVFKKLFSESFKGKFINLKLGDIEKWDSLGNFNLLLLIEKEFNFRFSNEEISELKSIKEILYTLQNGKIQKLPRN
jgi:acyl carrier protein